MFVSKYGIFGINIVYKYYYEFLIFIYIRLYNYCSFNYKNGLCLWKLFEEDNFFRL